jgi:hypothetical protein
VDKKKLDLKSRNFNRQRLSIAKRLNMKVQKIWSADIYRDGGSYGFCFDSDDGHWYEFFLEVRTCEQSEESHHPPVIFHKSVNHKNPSQQLRWEEAKAFIAPLHYDEPRFNELVAIVMREGRKSK